MRPAWCRGAAAAVLVALLFAQPAIGEAAPSTVPIKGRVLLPSGAPAAAVRVALTKEVGVGEAIFGVFSTALSLGLACLTQSLQICQDNVITSGTEADGTFTIQVPSSDVTTLFGNPRTFTVTAAAAAAPPEMGRAAVTEQFKGAAGGRRIADMHLWDPTLSLSSDQHSLSLKFGLLPSSAYGDGATYGARFLDVSGATSWEFREIQPGTTLDPRPLEDSVGTVVATASAMGTSAARDVSFEYQSGNLAYRGAAGAPLSRNKPCLVKGASGEEVRQSPCPLTDGDFFHPYQFPKGVGAFTCPPGVSPPAPTPSPLIASPAAGCTPQIPYIDLGASSYLSLVVARGCLNCEVDVSADGSSWDKVGAVQADQTATLPAGTQGRYARVFNPAIAFKPNEVSVWKGAPPGTAASDSGHSSSGALPPVLAVAMLLAALAVAALLISRRAGVRPVAPPRDRGG